MHGLAWLPNAPNIDHRLSFPETSERVKQEIIYYADTLISTMNRGVLLDGSNVNDALQLKQILISAVNHMPQSHIFLRTLNNLSQPVNVTPVVPYEGWLGSKCNLEFNFCRPDSAITVCYYATLDAVLRITGAVKLVPMLFC